MAIHDEAVKILRQDNVHVDPKQHMTQDWLYATAADARMQVRKDARWDVEFVTGSFDFAEKAVPSAEYRRWLYWTDLEGYNNPDPDGSLEEDYDDRMVVNARNMHELTVPYLRHIAETFYWHFVHHDTDLDVQYMRDDILKVGEVDDEGRDEFEQFRDIEEM